MTAGLGKKVSRLVRMNLQGWNNSRYDKDALREANSCSYFDEGQRALTFESHFAEWMGNDGRAFTYAAGRMALHEILASLKVGPGDEVVIPAFTCAVVANAVRRTGAEIVFSDISADNLGSDATSIGNRIGPKTRAVVAQHSFGYPCEIDEIVKICEPWGVPIVEDCATSFGSRYKGRLLGTWGDASFFSLDHTKPFSGHTGGVAFTANTQIQKRLSERYLEVGSLSAEQQGAMLRRACLEAKASPGIHLWWQFIGDSLARRLARRNRQLSFLQSDYGPLATAASPYPYPARLPEFAALLADSQLTQWPQTASRRQESLSQFLRLIEGSETEAKVPSVLFQQDASIVPLRIAWMDERADEINRRLYPILQTEATWFTSPLQVASGSLAEYGYIQGECPVAETHVTKMVNLPVDISHEGLVQLLSVAGLDK